MSDSLQTAWVLREMLGKAAEDWAIVAKKWAMARLEYHAWQQIGERQSLPKDAIPDRLCDSAADAYDMLSTLEDMCREQEAAMRSLLGRLP